MRCLKTLYARHPERSEGSPAVWRRSLAALGMTGVLGGGFALIANPVFSMEDASQARLIERIQPLGAVHVDSKAGSSPGPVTEAQPVVAERSGEAIFGQYCSICHESGIAGAPKFRNAEEWKPRIEKAGGIKGLLPIVNQGLNAMPPKGTCQDCSQEELSRAIEYMMPK
ncbi:MAG: c-type cytochrome [Gammaproteobacteria bacterium]|nr:c-type cytochrome [Gammaproteobacteria bacterium]